MAARYLIVNADDFGRSPGINRGIVRAHERGIVTSASLMVRWPAASEAAAYARDRPLLSVGLHVDLSEWVYTDSWTALYERVRSTDRMGIKAELSGQLTAFRELVGREPTHLDSHHHLHREEPVRSLLTDTARELGVPLRDFTPEIRYSGAFYGQTGKGEPLPEAIGVEALLAFLLSLPPGITELGCHPGEGDDYDSSYLSEREEEVKTLCDPRVRAALEAEEIELRSFADFPSLIESVD